MNLNTAPHVHDNGDWKMAHANHANVPLNILIHQSGPHDINKDGSRSKWVAEGDVYMPRKGHVSEAYRLGCDDRDVLVKYIQDAIRPLYETALSVINNLVNANDAGESEFHYWGTPPPRETPPSLCRIRPRP